MTQHYQRIGKNIDVGIDLGQHLHESVIKKGLQELNSNLHFDMGANLDLQHPMMNIRQGVFLNGKHMATMDRGSIPEYQVWGMRERKRFNDEGVIETKKVKTLVLSVGWRATFERLISKNIPGITRESVCKKFSVPVKYPTETPEALWNAG